MALTAGYAARRIEVLWLSLLVYVVVSGMVIAAFAFLYSKELPSLRQLLGASMLCAVLLALFCVALPLPYLLIAAVTIVWDQIVFIYQDHAVLINWVSGVTFFFLLMHLASRTADERLILRRAKEEADRKDLEANPKLAAERAKMMALFDALILQNRAERQQRAEHRRQKLNRLLGK
jgi:hypothetical protein